MNQSKEKYQSLVLRLKSDLDLSRLEIETERDFVAKRKLTKKLARSQAKAQAEALTLAQTTRDQFLSKWIVVAGVIAGASILFAGASWFGLIGFVGVAFILRK